MNESWSKVRLGDVIQAKYGKSLPRTKRAGGSVPVHGSNGVVGRHDAAITSGPTIVIGRKGSSGAVNFSDVPCWPIDTTYYIDEPGPFQIEFLDYLLRSLGLTELDRSTAIPGLNRDQLYDIDVPVPPPSEQARLVRLLQVTNKRQQSATGHINAAQLVVERFRQTILCAACSGRLTADWRAERRPELPEVPNAGGKRPKQIRNIENYDLDVLPDEWRWVQVNDLLPAGGIFDGPFGSNLKSSDYTESGARVIRLENVGHLTFIDSKKSFVSKEKYTSLLRHAVYPGDIIFASFIDERIRVCLLPDNLDRLALAKADCFTIRPVSAVLPQYLAMQLASSRSHSLLLGDIHGATRPRVNTMQVRSLPVPLCTTEEQKEIIRRYDALIRVADELEPRIRVALNKLDRSEQAVLAKAFRGEFDLAAGKASN